MPELPGISALLEWWRGDALEDVPVPDPEPTDGERPRIDYYTWHLTPGLDLERQGADQARSPYRDDDIAQAAQRLLG